MVESAAMPKGIRSYLVSVNDDGRRELHPVGDACSIVNLSDADNLVDHLRSSPRSAETLKKLHAFCAERLAQSGKAPTETTAKSEYVGELVSEVANTIYGMRKLAHTVIATPEESAEVANCQRCFVVRHWSGLAVSSPICRRLWLVRPLYDCGCTRETFGQSACDSDIR